MRTLPPLRPTMLIVRSRLRLSSKRLVAFIPTPFRASHAMQGGRTTLEGYHNRSDHFGHKNVRFLHFAVAPLLAFSGRLFFPLSTAARAVGMSGLSFRSARPAPQYRPCLNRLLLWTALSLVVSFLLALPFPLGCALRTELAPGQTFPPTGTAGDVFLR